MAKNGYKRRSPEEVRARRIRNKKRHRMIFRFMCVLLVCAAAIFATTVFFRVSEIRATGDTRYSGEEIIQASGISAGDNLFFLSNSKTKARLEDKFPYLDTIKLKRHLPGTLEIAVTEREPVMTAKLDDGSMYYLDITGKVLEKIKSEDAIGDTILVCGVNSKSLTVGKTADDTNDSKIIAVLDLLKDFKKYNILDKIVSVDITESFNVKANYDERYIVEMGTLDNVDHKIQFLISILKRDDLASEGIIDLSSDKEARYRPADIQTSEEQQEDTENEQETPQDGEQGTEEDTQEDTADTQGDWIDGEVQDVQPSETQPSDAQQPETQPSDTGADDGTQPSDTQPNTYD